VLAKRCNTVVISVPEVQRRRVNLRFDRVESKSTTLASKATIHAPNEYLYDVVGGKKKKHAMS